MSQHVSIKVDGIYEIILNRLHLLKLIYILITIHKENN